MTPAELNARAAVLYDDLKRACLQRLATGSELARLGRWVCEQLARIEAAGATLERRMAALEKRHG